MASEYLLDLALLFVLSLLSLVIFETKILHEKLPFRATFTSRAYRRFYLSIVVAVTIYVASRLVAARLDPTGDLLNGRLGTSPLVGGGFSGIIYQLLWVVAGALALNALATITRERLAQALQAKWSGLKWLSLSIQTWSAILVTTLLVVFLVAGVVILISTDPGGVFHSQAQDEKELFVRFTSQAVNLYENPGPGGRVLGSLDQNTPVLLVDYPVQKSVAGMVAVVVAGGNLIHQNGWVSQTYLLLHQVTRDPWAVLSNLLAAFAQGNSLPETGKDCLVSGVFILLVWLFFGQRAKRFSSAAAVLLGSVTLLIKYSLFNAGAIPPALLLLLEGLTVLLFDLVLSTVLWRLKPLTSFRPYGLKP